MTFRCTAALLLILLCSLAQGAQQLAVTQSGTEGPLAGGYLGLVFTLQDGESELAGETIYLTTSFGVLSALDLITDSDGEASVLVHSPSTGVGTVTAHTRAGAQASYNFVFTAPVGPQLFLKAALPVISTGQSNQLLIRAIDSSLVPIANRNVALSVASDSSGSITEPNVTLDADGKATTNYIPGPGGRRGRIFILAELDGTHGEGKAATAFRVASTTEGLVQFIDPPAHTDAEIDSSLEVKVRYTINGLPVDAWTIDATTDLGVVDEPAPRTDSQGFARFRVRSDTEGTARLGASTASLSDTLDIDFSHPDPDSNRYDLRYRKNEAANPVGLYIDTDRIGVLLSLQATYLDAMTMAAEIGFSLDTPISDRIFVLVAPEEMSRVTRWRLARSLKWRHPGKVLAAGLVARLSGTAKSFVIDDTIYVRFEESPMTDSDVQTRLKPLPIARVRRTPYGANEFALTMEADTTEDPLELSMMIANRPDVLYAHPDMARTLEPRITYPPCTDPEPWCDKRFGEQWAIENDGEFTFHDADADIREAWKITTGSKTTLIAVIDSGFDVTHPDLFDNLWRATPLGPYGFDLADGLHGSLLYTAAPSANNFAHGTNAAGVAAAVGSNVDGVSGVCPECTLLPIRVPASYLTSPFKDAFQIAVTEKADVISNSYGVWAILAGELWAIENAVSNGITTVFAASNFYEDSCDPTKDFTASDRVIAVGGVTDLEEKSYINGEAMGYGDCLDLVAPTGGGVRDISTTSTLETALGSTPTWVASFGGTSAATPLVAGVVALMRDQIPGIDPYAVQWVLQDTSDKVEPGRAEYDTESGYSNPLSGDPSTHGFGRINAYEAVRLVTDISKGGRGNKDLLLRDHALDWGNTEQSSNTIFSSPRETIEHLQSVDIKIDAEPFQVFNTVDPLASFLALQAEEPVSGKRSRVYVRVRNRGHLAITDSQLKLYWAVYKNGLPDLPADFFTNPGAVSDWQPLLPETVKDLGYSGASVAGCPARTDPVCLGAAAAPADQAQVPSFEVDVITWDISNERLAWLAVVDSIEDPVKAKLMPLPAGLNPKSVISNVVWDNNVTIWTSKPVCPPPWLLPLLIILALLAAALLAYIIYLLVQGESLPPWLVVIFLLVLLFLAWVAYLYATTEGCS